MCIKKERPHPWKFREETARLICLAGPVQLLAGLALNFATNPHTDENFIRDMTEHFITEALINAGILWSAVGFMTAFVWMGINWSNRAGRRLWVLITVLDAILAIPSGIVFLSQFGGVD